MSDKSDDVNKEMREIITRIRNLTPWLVRIRSSIAADQDAGLRTCLLSLRNDRSETLGGQKYSDNTLPRSKYLFVDKVRNALAVALERTDVSAFRKLDAIRCAIDFADAFDDIELDSWGTCSQDNAYRLAMSAFSVAMATTSVSTCCCDAKAGE
jgi:hypothetical protein